MRRRSKQFELDFWQGTWGGRRANAGRKHGPNPLVRHRARPDLKRMLPCHVTLKIRAGIDSLRSVSVVREVEAAFRRACERAGFRLVHYSIQDDHAHLIVEAENRESLARGMNGLGARFAHAVNRAFRRSGPVLRDRYHLHVLETPREVRHALAYVLLNARKHWAQRLARSGKRPSAGGLDPASSARWFDGWRAQARVDRSTPRALRPDPAVVPAETWLLRVGWRCHGLLDPLEVPSLRSMRPRGT